MIQPRPHPDRLASGHAARGPRARRVVALLGCLLFADGCALPWRSASEGGTASTGNAAAADLNGSEPESDADADAETAEALELLERMSAQLASLPAFRFRADVSYDAVQASDQRIEYGSTREIIVERPDRLRIDTRDRDGGHEILAYDGREVWLASPSLRAYARMEQAGGVDRILEKLAALDAPVPLAELIEPGLAARLRPSIESASRVGIAEIDGVLCDQVAYRTSGPDLQLFIERGEAPVPRRIVIDYRGEPGRPQFRATLRDWESGPQRRSAAFFRVTPPIGAQRMPLRELLGLMLEDPTGSSERGGVP